MGTTTFDRVAPARLALTTQRSAGPSAQRRSAAAAARHHKTTTSELLTIGVLIAVGSLLMKGALVPAQEWNSRQSAVDAAGRYIYKTRAFALRSSRNTWLVRDGNVLTVYIDSAGTPTAVGNSLDLRARYGVNLSATQDTLAFDPRGFVRSSAPVFVLSNKRGRDTVCVPGAREPERARCR
jgi:hypothetical protein